MGLENPNYLEDLVESNPVGAVDQRSEGDDHLRNLKRAIKNTFPGLSGRAWRKRTASASGNISINDNFVLIKAAGGITLTPAAAATLGDGFMTMVRADSGAVTIDPVENINGAGSLEVPNGYTAVIFSDGSEFMAYLVHHAVPVTTPAFPAGTRMLFHQTAAPAGWTKLTNSQFDNATLRMTAGTVGTGGLDAFTDVFGAGKTTASHTLTAAQMPVHNHGVTDPGHAHSYTSPAGGNGAFGGGSGNTPSTTGTSTTGITIQNAGSGQGHSHNLTMNPKYVDVIVAEKN